MVWSDERYQGFRETVRRANPEFTFSALRNTSQTDLWLYDPIQLTTWLQSLPKPVAIMACDDNQAYHITEACCRPKAEGENPHPGRHCRTRRRQRRDDLPAVGTESLVA
ncbi:MAG: substrate-binding domain-containing protein [Alistipes senegalensis]